MSIDHNRIKVADLEKNQSNKTLVTNEDGQLEFRDYNLKADLESPNFSGVPLAPTAELGTNTTQVATTAFVLANAAAYKNIVSTSAPTGVPHDGQEWIIYIPNI